MKKVSLQHIMKLIALFGVLVFFLPTYLISCSGEEIKFSAYRALTGYDELGTDPHIGAIFLILIPIVILVLSVMKKEKLQAKNLLILIGFAVNIVCWFIMTSCVKGEAGEYGASAKTTIWYWLNLILLFLAALAALGVVMGVLDEDMSVNEAGAKLGADKAQGGAGFKIPAAFGAKAWNCPNCGQEQKGENGFCTNCGTKRPEEPVVAKRFCTNCGKELAADAKFCANCGTAAAVPPVETAQTPAVEEAQAPAAQEAPAVEEAQASKTEDGQTAE